MVNYKKLGKLLIWRCKQKRLASQLPTATMATNEEVEEVPSLLLPCASCGRTFRPEALAKHSKVCEKTLMKKRKQFDSAKQRLQGTEIESFVTQPITKNPRKKEPQLNPSKAKIKEKIDLAKTIQVAKKSLDPPPCIAQVKPSEHEECPYCGRSFGPKAFERHTEFCKEQHQKLKLTPTINNEAKERLKVRTSYRGPLTHKVLNRDRYQPNRNRDPSPMGNSLTDLRDEGGKSKGLMRNAPLRSSLRSRPTENVAPPPLRRTMTQINPPRSVRGSRDSVNEPNEKSIENNTKNQSAANKPRIYSRESIEKNDAEKYNPYLSAERQMMELFGVEDIKPRSTLPEIPGTSPIQSTPTSAFVKYSSPKRSSSLESVKCDNKENNDNSIIIDTSQEEKVDNRRNFSLSNLSLCSVVSIDSIDCNKNSVNSRLLGGHLDDFQRSFSALEPKPSRTHNKTKVNLQEMLYGSQSPEHASHSESSNSDASNLEACEAELLISMLEFEKMLKGSPDPSPESTSPLCSSTKGDTPKASPRNNKSTFEKNQRNLNNSIDSAYSRSSGAEGEKDRGKQSELPKFCHECGSKYPVAMAKFCCNCGMRRIAL